MRYRHSERYDERCLLADAMLFNDIGSNWAVGAIQLGRTNSSIDPTLDKPYSSIDTMLLIDLLDRPSWWTALLPIRAATLLLLNIFRIFRQKRCAPSSPIGRLLTTQCVVCTSCSLLVSLLSRLERCPRSSDPACVRNSAWKTNLSFIHLNVIMMMDHRHLLFLLFFAGKILPAYSSRCPRRICEKRLFKACVRNVC